MSSSVGQATAEQSLANLEKLYTEEVEVEEQAGPPKDWSRLRCVFYVVLRYQVKHTPVFEIVVASIVLLNMCFVAVEAEEWAQCVMRVSDTVPCTEPLWLSVVNYLFILFYCAEFAIRAYVGRCEYFKNWWNYIDMLVIATGIAHAAFEMLEGFSSGVSVLRFFRIMRVARIVKAFKWIPTLWRLLSGLVGAMYAMFWGFFLIVLMLLIWAYLAVEFLHPIAWHVFANGDDDWCRATFSTMPRSTLFMFVSLITGDNWGQCAIPIIEHAPLTALIFGISFLTVQLGFLNLLLAVIVDQAAAARETATAARLEEHKAETAQQFFKWEDIMRDMDVHRSGTVSLDEFKEAYAKDEVVQSNLAELGCEAPDVETLFELMDLDSSGTLSYSEFITSMMKTLQKPGFSMAMVELRLQKLDHMVGAELAQRLQDMERRMTDAIAAAVERPLDAAGEPQPVYSLGPEPPPEHHTSELRGLTARIEEAIVEFRHRPAACEACGRDGGAPRPAPSHAAPSQSVAFLVPSAPPEAAAPWPPEARGEPPASAGKSRRSSASQGESPRSSASQGEGPRSAAPPRLTPRLWVSRPADF